MFLQVSVILLRGSHVTITHDAFDIPRTWKLGIYPLLLLTSGGHHWRPVQTCLLEDYPPLTGADT